jgi:hypothetical protein
MLKNNTTQRRRIRMAKPSRRSMKDALTKRLEGDYNKRKGGGSLFRSDIRGVNFWSCKEGDHIIDIIPYITGANDPIGANEDGYVLELYVHQDVGVKEGMIICLSETFNKPCPICEEKRRLIKKGADEETIKNLTPSRYPRSIYNIICYDTKEEQEKGIQIWHTSNWLMQQYLLALAKRSVRPGQSNVEPFIAFMDADDGRSIAFKREGKEKATKYIGIRFEERNYKISQEILDSAKCLDELIAWPTYDEVYQDFFGVVAGGESTAVETKTAPTERSRKYEEEKKEDDVPEPDQLSERSRSRREPDPEPAREEGRRSRQETKDDADPPRGRRQEPDPEPTKGGKCPAGKDFGIDIDNLKACDSCPVWKDCAKESDRIEKEKKSR